MDGQATGFIDGTALITVCLIPLGMMLWGGCNVTLMIKSIFSNHITNEELNKAITDWGHARTYYLTGGGACALIGIAEIIVGSPDPAKIGPGMATALLGTLYAIFLSYASALPTQVYLKNRAGLPLDQKETSGAAIVSTFTLFLWLITLYSILHSFNILSK